MVAWSPWTATFWSRSQQTGDSGIHSLKNCCPHKSTLVKNYLSWIFISQIKFEIQTFETEVLTLKIQHEQSLLNSTSMRPTMFIVKVFSAVL